MPRITVTIPDALDEYLEEESGDDGEFDSKSEVMRSLAERGRDAEGFQERIDDLEEELESVCEHRDRLQGTADKVEDLKQKVERLENEKRLILEQREEKQELARYVEDERETQQQWREAPLWTRVKWRVVGMPAE
jgi:Arc/MetJ-type ribon-helix-helix transcriptional regulator